MQDKFIFLGSKWCFLSINFVNMSWCHHFVLYFHSCGLSMKAEILPCSSLGNSKQALTSFLCNILHLIWYWQVQLAYTIQDFLTWGFGHVRGLVQLYRWRHVNVVMTKEPYVVNNLLLFTVLSYDVTVDSWQWRHGCLGVVHCCHLVEVGRSSVGGSRGWTSKLQSGSMSIINSLIEKKRKKKKILYFVSCYL